MTPSGPFVRPPYAGALSACTPLLLALILALLSLDCAAGDKKTAKSRQAAAPAKKPANSAITTPWRGAWCSTTKPEIIVPAVEKLRFNAIIAHPPPKRTRELAHACREAGLECYYWLSLDARTPEERRLAQVLSPEDKQALKKMAADPTPGKHGCQFGGEALPGHHDVMVQSLLCFHHPETAALLRAKIRKILINCPELTGIALDYFGYQNHHCCLCDASKAAFATWRKKHPEVPAKDALDQFSLESLIAFINETADTVRELKPGAKTVIHVYPVFQPQPLYGSRLKVDYCCETVAWFFKPYWPDDKIVRYTRVVTNREGRAWPQSRGIPFIGLFVGRKAYANKSPERLAHELTLVFHNCPSRSLSIYKFDEFLKSTPHRQALERVLDTVWPE
jgi:hypothetical protein